ncbi:MAG: YitT family protein [Solobacterium sp.]|jgi:uncharacterized membrane-anchored protein YitT (DUF2179 family)|uniref:YitT family protein n=1 Tax=Stecheria intestinalis TaxID=2606630 RepID=UPI0023F00F97|nr:YitT family protein [Stecheria intestinalis]MCI2153254.1 YitT family protein [Solobacterium sp.]MDD5880628.1 YitT family protein [Stecheria intestinalis]MDY4680766.1 YitT family protein [Lachnospiraceae bacterium]
MSDSKQSLKESFGKKDLLYIAMVVLSSAIYSFGMNTFVKSGNLFPSGYAGIARLISQVLINYTRFHITFSPIYFLLNIITTVFIWNRIGHKFVLLSLIWFSLTSLFTGIFPVMEITSEPMLISVFGGVINGFAIGIALRNNASSGGTDFIAIFLSQKLNRPTWNYIMVANAAVLGIAGYLFGWNRALYSIIFQFVSTQMVNTMHQRYRSTELKVVTNMPDEVCSAVFHTCRHGITKIPCEGGFTDKPHWLLLITLNTYQVKQVIEMIHATDPHAFITMYSVEKIIGNYYQKPLE